MVHTSVALNSPVEFVNATSISPLISKVQIKVCYVGEEPNRNGSIITKEVATDMAGSLHGAAIVGFYNEASGDFEEHNRAIEISGGEWKFKDVCKPYGFVDLNAKVWFQKFLDDNAIEHEYLMTEGYLWTDIYPEAQRVIDKGNNHSMELDEKSLDGTWAKKKNLDGEFFLINEAIISKLCILGEEFEPCFEGSRITKAEFSLSLGEEFNTRLYSMMNELKEILDEGGAKEMFNVYTVEIGDALWKALYNHVGQDATISGVFEENGQKFAILLKDEKAYRQDFTYDTEFAVSGELVEFTEEYEPQFTLEAINAWVESQKPAEGAPKYVLDEIPEYIELQNKYSELETKYNNLVAEKNTVDTENNALKQFKLQTERKEKEALIASFYMLNDEDKADVKEKIDTYSLEEIESKLCVICVRNKVSFSQEEENKGITTFSLDGGADDDITPAWIKAALEVEKNI